MAKWLDTTLLPDKDQRAEPHEILGQVFGTAGTPPYVHLQLETSKRLFGQTMPTLVANDGVGPDADRVRELAEQYGADYVGWESIGHSPGDIRIFHESMKWASDKGIDIVAKFSRRSIPLISWRHGLQFLAAYNTDAAFFTRRHLDTPHGLFRTDAIAYRLRQINNPRVVDAMIEAYSNKIRLNVESVFDAWQQVSGGWVMWDLLGPNFYKPWNKMMQWRGLLPYHYGDLSRQLDLPYSDLDFLSASFGIVRIESDLVPASSTMKVIQVDGRAPLTVSCGFVPPTPGYAPCTRPAGHDGPCAHSFDTDAPPKPAA